MYVKGDAVQPRGPREVLGRPKPLLFTRESSRHHIVSEVR